MSSDEQTQSLSLPPTAENPNNPGPEQPQVEVEVESASDTSSEEFSNYASSLASSTTSLSSDIFDYQYENGRRYHAYRAGKYLLPNDEVEQERLDITHHVFRLSLVGDLCISKLRDDGPQRILDVGTGTGIWAIEMGDLHPAAEVIGTDLSPIQPQFVPPNVRFVIDDATDDWAFPTEHFDFIFVRTMGGSIQDWPKFLRACYDHLKPGGKLEIAEGRANFWYLDDGSVSENSYTYRWLMEWRRLSAKLHFDVFPLLPGMIEQLPFEKLTTVEKLCPLGGWPKDRKLKEVGRWFKAQFLEMALEAYTLALFVRVGGWQELEVKALLAHVRGEMTRSKMHLYTFCSYVACEKRARESSG